MLQFSELQDSWKEWVDGVWISVLYKPISSLDGLCGHWGIGVIGSCFLVHLLLIKTVFKKPVFYKDS